MVAHVEYLPSASSFLTVQDSISTFKALLVVSVPQGKAIHPELFLKAGHN